MTQNGTLLRLKGDGINNYTGTRDVNYSGDPET